MLYDLHMCVRKLFMNKWLVCTLIWKCKWMLHLLEYIFFTDKSFEFLTLRIHSNCFTRILFDYIFYTQCSNIATFALKLFKCNTVFCYVLGTIFGLLFAITIAHTSVELMQATPVWLVSKYISKSFFFFFLHIMFPLCSIVHF